MSRTQTVAAERPEIDEYLSPAVRAAAEAAGFRFSASHATGMLLARRRVGRFVDYVHLGPGQVPWSCAARFRADFAPPPGSDGGTAWRSDIGSADRLLRRVIDWSDDDTDR
ncbi:hypothetical protein GCM10017786_09180 [Amycolatopsis deserti]|uniref:Uncharacterized protein n=1 Tax=Amycolatopsis deserti TaxID=185696 RepID=A0ABQ3IFC7_9PSEU|nr:hypothetical protein [Amycolatopsis deserti]GHE81051.1 hypothetical protein GCM10017786_09180 [Amycolatopsis deserti]